MIQTTAIKNKMMLKLFIVFFIASSFSAFANNSDNIKIQLPWYPSIEYIDFFACSHYGIFKKNGLKVDLKFYSPGINVVNEVLDKNADIGLQDSIPIIQEVFKDKKIISFFNLYQETPLSLVSLSSKNIKNIDDLSGKVLITHKGYEYYFDYLLLKYPYLKGKVKIKYIDDPSILIHAAIEQGLGDVGTVFEMVQAPLFRSKGTSINIIRYHELGFNIVSHLLFAREDYFKSKRNQIKKLTESILECHEYIKKNPKKVILDLSIFFIKRESFLEYKFKNEKDYIDYLEASLKIMLHYVQMDNTDTVGIINTNQTKQLIKDIEKIGLIKNKKIDIDQFITNSILKEIYDKKQRH